MILESWDQILAYLESGKLKINYYRDYPQIIHQSWKTLDIPSHWKISNQKWVEYHPDYVYILWTDEMNLKLVETFYPDYLEQFQKYKYNIQRADFSRICYLHRYGGIYSDLDIAPNKDCTPLIDFYQDSTKEVGLILDAGEFNCHISNFIMKSGSALSRAVGVIANNFSRYTNMFMISKRKSVFWEYVLKESRNHDVPKKFSSRHFYIMWMTGPFLIDRVVKAGKNKNIVYNIPPEYVNPCTVCEAKPCTKKDAYVTMLAGSSWADTDSTIITWFACHWVIVAIVGIIILVLIIAYFLAKSRKK